jgi:hypothetical protein
MIDNIKWYNEIRDTFVQTDKGIEILKEWESICNKYTLITEVIEFMYDNKDSIKSEPDFFYYMDQGMREYDL